MPRRRDTIRIESEAGSFDAFNNLVITNDITNPSELTFDVGDDGSWESLSRVLSHGTRVRVFLNDRIRMAGRIDVQDAPTSASGGSTIQITVRTKLMDARVGSADPKVKVSNTSIRDFLIALYRPLGYVASDFVFSAGAERDLITGIGSKGAASPVSLDPIRAEQAKVNPPETIFDAAARHLKRHGLMHWDTPDGKIFVGAPDDKQIPIYVLRSRRGANAQGNNLLSAKRVLDWSDAPTEVRVHGYTGGVDTERIPVRGYAANLSLIEAGFHRPVVLQAEAVRGQGQADRAARRERAARSRRLDAFDLSIDGWSYWDGKRQIPFGVNTTADVLVDTVGGPQGRYYVQRVVCTLDTAGAQKTNLSVVAPGVWEI